MTSRSWMRPATWFLAYLLTGWLVVILQPTSGASLWYPPIAIGLLLLLVDGLQFWPLVFLADFAIAAFQYPGGLAVAAIVAGNTVVEVVLVAALFKRFAYGGRLQDNDGLLRFVLITAIATGLGATLGCLLFSALRLLPPETLFNNWTFWWLGDMTTVLCLVPPLLMFCEEGGLQLGRQLRANRPLRFEVVLLLLATVLLGTWVAVVARSWTDPEWVSLRPLAFVPILWAAIRLGPALTGLLVVVSNVVTVVAVWLLVPLLHGSWEASVLGVLDVQIFMLVLSLGGVALSLAIAGERRLRANEELFRVALERAPYPSIIHAEGGEVLGLSHAWEDLTGQSAKEVTSFADWLERTFLKDPQGRLPNFTQVFEKPERLEQGQWQVLGKDGQEHTWDPCSMALGRLPDGRRMAINMAVDLTERQQSEALTRLFYDLPFIGMAITSPQTHRWLRVNDRLCEILGYPREELLTKTWSELTHPEDLAADLDQFEKLLAGEIDGYEMDKRFIRKDGTVIFTIINFRCVRHDGGTPRDIVATVQDITRHRQLEEHLRQSEKMNAIGQLAGGVAHDFNNQLTSVIGYAEMLKTRLVDERLQGYAQRILKAAEGAARLTQQLLSFSRKGKFLSMPVQVHRLLEEVINILHHSIDKKISLHQAFRAGQETVLGDPSQLQSAFLNLAINARDAMPEGGELTFATEVVDLDREACNGFAEQVAPGRFLQVMVSDTGCGMSPEVVRHIFEPFFTTKEAGKGTGMGLASVYGTVVSHKGTIDVASSPGQGTTVAICLPLAEGAVAAAEPPMMPLPAGSGRILIIDDEPLVRDIARELLETLGYEVTVCADGQEALALYRDAWQQIDLVLLDMVMPGMDGRETFHALQQINPDIRAVLSSGYHVDDKAQALLEEGVLAYVGKPFKLKDLAETIDRALKGRTAPNP